MKVEYRCRRKQEDKMDTDTAVIIGEVLFLGGCAIGSYFVARKISDYIRNGKEVTGREKTSYDPIAKEEPKETFDRLSQPHKPETGKTAGQGNTTKGAEVNSIKGGPG